MSYIEEHKASGLKAGDKVRVTRRAESDENGWKNSWLPEMDWCIDKIFEIEVDRGKIGFELKDSRPGSKYGWCFPYFILEKVLAEPKPEKEATILIEKNELTLTKKQAREWAIRLLLAAEKEETVKLPFTIKEEE